MPPATRAILERVLRKLRTGEMPPAGMPRPAAPVVAAFTKSLEESLDRAAAANPNPGRPAVHRLNRVEYSNAIRDVLALDIRPGASLPVDDSGYGFDNIGDVLSISPALLEKYMSAARMVSRLAVGDTNIKPSVEDLPARRDGPGGGGRERNERVSDDLPFDSRGGFALRYYFPVDAEYVIRVTARPGRRPGGDRKLEIRQPVAAGLRTIGVTFLRESAKPEIALLGGRGAPPPPPPQAGGPGGPGGRPLAPMAELDLRLDGVKLKRFEVPENNNPPQATGLTISGPYNITGPGDTPSRARIFVCHPASAKDEEPCARTILAARRHTAPSAVRSRTPTSSRCWLSIAAAARSATSISASRRRCARCWFLPTSFSASSRIRRAPRPATVYRISDLELASRLSFFLWSTVPDDQLLDLAEKGKLRDPAVLDAQVRRLLDDPRADSLVSNFAGQWLYIRNLEQQKPDPDIFPEFDESLRQSFQRETELFFQNIVREDRSVMELLDANYTFLNQRLAEHYGIPNIYGAQFRKVTLTDPNRGGLLGQGSILTVTSYPNRTSVVQRGKWILDNLLGSPPPPPPQNFDLESKGHDGRVLTMREAMELHRSNADLSILPRAHGPHRVRAGKLRRRGQVARSGCRRRRSTLRANSPAASSLRGRPGSKKILVSNYRDQFEDTVTEKLLTYALGRGLEYYDKPAVRSIMRQAERDNFRISALIGAIVKSTPFQMRRTPEP